MENIRKSGILLHPTSLWGEYGIGDMGTSAYEFIDFLAKNRQTLWQVLPLCPVGGGNSPYQSICAFAGNTLLISPELMEKYGYIVLGDIPDFPKDHVDYKMVSDFKEKIFKEAYLKFLQIKDEDLKFSEFCIENAYWLEDFSVFSSLKEDFGEKFWFWPKKFAYKDPDAIYEYKEIFSEKIDYYKFLQYIFFKQWKSLKKYANEKGISIIGDMPIFVSLDSSDVWSNPKLFDLDENLQPSFVAGVPPDYFSDTGQFWGNPLYDWSTHRKTGYNWWLSRMRHAKGLVDILRIDHFRGFESYWRIPAESKDARLGEWVLGPGKELFDVLSEVELPLIAEDLGIITPKVKALKEDLGFPGMKVLQFAFADDEKNPYLPHNYDEMCVVYTGTHDNDTTKGWYNNAGEEEKDYFRKYLNIDGENASWDMIRLAMSSVARYAVLPAQDVMNLGSEGRMNLPGTPFGNWEWRIKDKNELFKNGRGLLYFSKVFNRNI